MNEWNPVENWLREWRPRRPAPRIRARLFPPAATAAAPATAATWANVARWLTPATALAMLFCLLVSQRTHQFFTMSKADTPVSLAAAAFSNQFYAAYLPASGHSQQNAWPDTKIRWTNDGHLASSMGLFPRVGTNHARW
jgi:hypothetical protein